MGTRKSKYVIPTNFAPATRLLANRWLSYASFGAATARSNLTTSTKIAIVPLTVSTAISPGGLEEDDAARLMRIGYEAYTNEQLADASPKSAMNLIKADPDGGGGTNNAVLRQIFWTELMHGSAQTRLKAAYALSQIFVVNSLANSGGNGDPFAHKYYDNLVKSTLSTNTSSFRALLSDVAYSVTMARMLTYVNNRRANPATALKPDQNFIRELLQLMCPGLFHQNIDGTFVLDANGVKIQTFLPSQIELLAGAITGLGDNTLGGAATLFNTGDGRRLYEFATEATFDAVTLPALLDGSVTTIPAKLQDAGRLNFQMPVGGYIVLAAGLTANTFDVTTEPSLNSVSTTNRPFSYRLTNNFTSATNRIDATLTQALNATTATITKTAHGLTAGTAIFSKGNIQETIDLLLDWCFNHPSTAPFFAKSMIKHFVTSNPTPDYVKRVALKFIDNGNGVRGDISAVVKAILMDREAIFNFGVNPNNHGRYLTVPERIGRVARAFRADNVHVQGNDNKFIAGSAGAIFTKPAIDQDYAACGVYNTTSFRPYESPSIFNFFLPDFQPKGEVLEQINKASPESQIEVSGTKTAWANMVLQLCDTQMPESAFDNFVELPTSPNVINNPTGNQGVSGFDFVPSSTGYTVTAVSATHVTIGYTIMRTTTTSRQLAFRARRQSTGLTHGILLGNMPLGTAGGAGSFAFFVANGSASSYVLNDVLDIEPLVITGYAGFPNRKLLNTGNNLVTASWHTYNILFHSVANQLTSLNAVALPTEAQLTPAISYIESILMTQPISTEIKALMVQAGQVPRTAIAPYIDGDTAWLNNFKHVVMSVAQLRARAMVAMLLVSPEFSSLR